ncbi:MAG: hypothetical protein HY824_11270 [Acidobacteria bacterium]|nr:hypothetical protein [Acidobacteriota bacterium]
MRRESVPSPWAGFLDAAGRALSAPVDVHCLGGFVVSVCHGLTRPTVDVDVLSATPHERLQELLSIGGRGSALARKYRVYLDHVTVATVPDGYEARLQPVFADRFDKLRLFALEPHDLALAKLERNHEVDRDDVRFLASAVPLDVTVLRARYLRELRPLLGNPTREDLTLDLWAEMIAEARGI